MADALGRYDGTDGKEFRFQKGIVPKNTLHDGAITKRHTGGKYYWFIRIAACKWEYLHRYMWKKEYGDIPPKHHVAFRNGDTLDCRIENLACVTKKEEAAMYNMSERVSKKMKEHWHRAKIRYKAVLPPSNGYGELIESGKYQI